MILLNIIINNSSKEGNVLFNDALNTFYLRLYGVRHMANETPSTQTDDSQAMNTPFFVYFIIIQIRISQEVLTKGEHSFIDV